MRGERRLKESHPCSYQTPCVCVGLPATQPAWPYRLIVTAFAERLQVIPLPEQTLITTMRLDMVEQRGLPSTSLHLQHV
jgi:hypothetical protein